MFHVLCGPQEELAVATANGDPNKIPNTSIINVNDQLIAHPYFPMSIQS
jgi:hypothetical protein